MEKSEEEEEAAGMLSRDQLIYFFDSFPHSHLTARYIMIMIIIIIAFDLI